jgi:hypothetical protein
MGQTVGLVQRIGGMLVAPRQTLGLVLGGAKGGVRDLVWLLLLQVIAVQLPHLAVAVMIMLRQSYSSGMSLLLNTVAGSAWMPLAAAIAGAVVIGPLVRGRTGRERSVDVCALCAVPPVALQLVASLLTALGLLQPSRWLAIAVLASGGLWFVALLPLGVHMIRGTPAEPEAER